MPDSTLSSLSSAGTLTGDELLYLVQSGGDKKITQRSLVEINKSPDENTASTTKWDRSAYDGLSGRIVMSRATTDSDWSMFGLTLNGIGGTNGLTGFDNSTRGRHAFVFENEWDSGEVEAIRGTVSVTAGTKAVTGTGTIFSQLKALDSLKIGTQVCVIESITNDLSLTLKANHVAGASGVSATTGKMALTGTVSVIAGSSTVTGVGTEFLSELAVGGFITLISDVGSVGHSLQITSIDSNLSLTLRVAMPLAVTSSVAYTGGIRQTENWLQLNSYRMYQYNNRKSDSKFANGNFYVPLLIDVDETKNSYIYGRPIATYSGKYSVDYLATRVQNTSATKPSVSMDLRGLGNGSGTGGWENWFSIIMNPGFVTAGGATRELVITDRAVNAYRMYIDQNGNHGLGGTTSGHCAYTFGTNAQGVLGMKNGVEPTTSPADLLQIFAVDLSAGNSTLGLRTETAVVTESVVSDRTLSVRINGATYKICLKV